MGFIKSFADMLKGNEELDENFEGETFEEDEEEEQAEPVNTKAQAQSQPQSAPKASTASKTTGGVSSSAALNMKVIKPESLQEAKPIGRLLLDGFTVVLNIEQTNKETQKRLLDFLGGVVFAIDGNVNKVSNTTYVVSPKNVAVQNDDKPASDGDTEGQPRDIFR